MARTRERTRPDISGNPGYITAEGYRRLEEEAYHLWNVKRLRVTKAVADAAAEGDRSENAEYIYRKKQLADIHRRLRFLGKRLDVLEVVSDKPEEDGRVYFGCYVLVEDEEGRLEGLVTYRGLIRLIGKKDTDQITVRDIMKTDLRTVTPETPTIDAIHIVRKHQVGCLPVLRDGRLVGVLTMSDFLPLYDKLIDELLAENQQ